MKLVLSNPMQYVLIVHLFAIVAVNMFSLMFKKKYILLQTLSKLKRSLTRTKLKHITFWNGVSGILVAVD